ncbi:efflux RND transporter periplasmic adaptor subunit [Alteromonas gilva]|uniref:Efflux RND transporter periplasmic adaptor subunit n=1 Tax=Alteromonas gilva TaxID=2987522 RepID=A0ABT5L304_9ALTE|nr:efflux RND transporter periplasmic adaptor subunit [Alteromonas gilva]MDC8831421.1 efflux RND transporter periplasmic adaptor subunit [Alteromonas gilva]
MNRLITARTGAILGLIFAIGGCSGEAEQQTPQPVPAKLVKTVILSPGDNNGYREFPAVVEASEEATLAFRVSGELNHLHVSAGQMVESGDVLASLDPTDYQIAVDQAQANYDLAKVQFDRTQTLLDKQLTSQAGYDQARAELQVAASALKSAKTNLAYTELHAPFSGQVAQRFVENFESITAQQPVLSLQKNTVVEVAIQIPEDLLSNIDKDTQYQPEVRLDTHPEQVFRARLKEYDTDADAATNTYKVVFEMNRPASFNVFPGMSATVRAQLDQVMKMNPASWHVPAAAIFTNGATDNEQSYVFVVGADNLLEQRAVTLGSITDDGFRVTAGLNAGDEIVAAGVHRLTAGERVRVWHKERGL